MNVTDMSTYHLLDDVCSKYRCPLHSVRDEQEERESKSLRRFSTSPSVVLTVLVLILSMSWLSTDQQMTDPKSSAGITSQNLQLFHKKLQLKDELCSNCELSEKCTASIFRKYTAHYKRLAPQVLYDLNSVRTAFQGRTHFSVGDSISKQAHEALCRVLAIFFGPSDKVLQPVMMRKNISEHSSCEVWKEYELIVCWMSAKGRDSHAHVGDAVTKLALLTDCTSVVLNAGLHYARRLRELHTHVAQLVDNIHIVRGTLAHAAPVFFWRETTPQFFPGGGAYTFSKKRVRCEVPSNVSNIFNDVTNPLVNANMASIKVLSAWDEAAETALPWVRGYVADRNITDCTHFCFLAPIWDDFNRQMIRELYELDLPRCAGSLGQRVEQAQFLISAAV